MSAQSIASTFVLAGTLTLLPPVMAEARPSQESRRLTGDANEQPPAEDEQNADEDEQEPDEEEPVDLAPDAHRDPVLARLLKPLIHIERPGYSIESHGRLQADADDPELEDDLFLRLFRPYIFGRIGRGETLAPSFTGGSYTDGDTRLKASVVEGAYRIPRSPVELGGALSRFDADGFTDTWGTATAVVNLYMVRRFMYKLQLSHTWDSSRLGVLGDDFQTTRIQLQYVW